MLLIDSCLSGTGNTLRALKTMKSTFEKNGKEVTLFPLEKCTPKDFMNGGVAGKTAYGLVFPIYAEVSQFFAFLITHSEHYLYKCNRVLTQNSGSSSKACQQQQTMTRSS